MRADLVCLTADKNMEAALETLLEKRKEALGLREFELFIRHHPQHDPGCYHDGPAFLTELMYNMGTPVCRGLLLFDRNWSGNPHKSATDTERVVRERFEPNVRERIEVIVIEPELEAWVWSDSPHVAEALGWEARELRLWLQQRGLWPPESPKPEDPKEAMEAALREKGHSRSSSTFRHIARKVSLKRCEDPSFRRLKRILAGWFPAER